MATLYDDDFQSYALAANPPYGSLEQIGVAAPVIAAATPAFFGDVKTVSCPAFQCLQYPTAAPTHLLPFNQQLTVFFGVNLSGADSELGTIMQCYGQNLSDYATDIYSLRILNDGTLALGTGNGLNWYGVSDFSLLENQWYWFQVNVAFGSSGGFVTYTTTIAVNGQVVLTLTNQSTGQSIGNFPSGYCNFIKFGGAGSGLQLGRLSIFNPIQAIGSVPHPGTPSAFVTQGVIELLTSTVPPPTPPDPPPGPPPGPPVPGPGGCAEQSKLSAAPVQSVAGTAAPSIPGQTNSLKSKL